MWHRVVLTLAAAFWLMLVMTSVVAVAVKYGGRPASGKGAEPAPGLSRPEDAPVVAVDQPDAARQPAKLPPKEEWANADKGDAPTIGDVAVRVKAAEMGRPWHFTFGGQSRMWPENCLVLWIEVLNWSGTRKVDYNGWGWRHSDAALTDTFDNRYKRFHNSFGDPLRYNWIIWRPGETVGKETRLVMVDRASILPSTGLSDLLVFEEVAVFGPPHHLKLELPAANVGREGTYRFKIPFGMITRE